MGTPDQLSSLRGTCLIRDHRRCVISRHFDVKAAQQRLKANGDNAADDDGVPLRGEELEYLEVAHIIPHALASSDGPSKLLVRFLLFV